MILSFGAVGAVRERHNTPLNARWPRIFDSIYILIEETPVDRAHHQLMSRDLAIARLISANDEMSADQVAVLEQSQHNRGDEQDRRIRSRNAHCPDHRHQTTP